MLYHRSPAFGGVLRGAVGGTVPIETFAPVLLKYTVPIPDPILTVPIPDPRISIIVAPYPTIKPVAAIPTPRIIFLRNCPSP